FRTGGEDLVRLLIAGIGALALGPGRGIAVYCDNVVDAVVVLELALARRVGLLVPRVHAPAHLQHLVLVACVVAAVDGVVAVLIKVLRELLTRRDAARDELRTNPKSPSLTRRRQTRLCAASTACPGWAECRERGCRWRWRRTSPALTGPTSPSSRI
ncbi:hypothetical protein PENTCL1PPCAC_5161, partial [Pristionchus entomophagus]